MKRRLPLAVEKSLASLKNLRLNVANNYQRELSSSDVKVACKKGCSNCCYHPVLITVLEGLLIHRWLVAHGRWSKQIQTLLANHAEKTKDLPFELWFLSMTACPLLDKEGRCSVYEARPEVCRLTYSLAEPENCHPHQISETSMLNKQAVLSTYHQEQGKIAQGQGLSMTLLPLSLAILIASKVESGEVELGQIDYTILKEYAK